MSNTPDHPSGNPAAPSGLRGAPLPPEETVRIAALRRYAILDTPPKAAFDRITAGLESFPCAHRLGHLQGSGSAISSR